MHCQRIGRIGDLWVIAGEAPIEATTHCRVVRIGTATQRPECLRKAPGDAERTLLACRSQANQVKLQTAQFNAASSAVRTLRWLAGCIGVCRRRVTLRLTVTPTTVTP